MSLQSLLCNKGQKCVSCKVVLLGECKCRSAHGQALTSATCSMTVTHRIQASPAGHVCDAGLQVVPSNVLAHPSHNGCLAASYSALQPTLAGRCCGLPLASGRSLAAGQRGP